MFFFKKNEKDKEEPLAIGREVFCDIFVQSAMGEAVVDLEGTYLDVNERFCNIIGYHKEEVLGKNLAEVTHPDDVQKTNDVLQDILLKKIPFGKLEKRYIRKDGSIVWGFLNIALICGSDGKPHYFFGQVQDITEAKEKEQKLRESEQKYSTLVEKGNDGVIIIQDFLIKFANSKLLEWTGYSKEEIQEKHFLSFVAPEYMDLIKKNYVRRFAGEKVDMNYKVEIVKKDGKKMSVEISGSLINYQGKPADMVVFRDITEREKAEEELKKYKFIVEQSNQQIALADLNGNIVFANESFAKNHGYSLKDIIGKNLSLFHSKEELAKVENANKILKEKGKYNGEIIHMRKDGSTYPTLMDNFVLSIDSKPKYYVGMAIDTTKLKEVEKELKKQKALLDSVIKSIDEALLVIGTKGKVEFYNERFKALWKIPDKIINQNDDKKLLNYIASQLTDFKEFLVKVNYLYSHPAEDSVDFIYLKDKRILSRHSFPHRVGENIIGRIWSFVDITKEKEIDKAKTEFVSLASHQLRAPATAVKWYSEMLLDKKTGELNKKQSAYLKEIYNGNERMIRLVNNLLSISKIELGKISIKNELIDVGELFESVIKEQKKDISERKHSITIKQPVKFLKISADPVLLRVIFQNFLSNAVKYTKNKGKLICVIKKEDSKFLFSIKDNGVGIPQKEQRRIFEKLFRASNALESDKDGNGLGLYIAKQIALALGGRVWFESKLGKGTTFYLELPIKNKL